MKRTSSIFLLLIISILVFPRHEYCAERDGSDPEKRKAYLKELLRLLPPHKEYAWRKWLKKTGELPPDFSKLPSQLDLPDPMIMNNGTRVTTKAQWDTRREEIKAMLQQYLLGHMPPPPENMKARQRRSKVIFDGECDYREVRLNFGPKMAVKMDVSLAIPKKGEGPFPAIIVLDWGRLRMPRTREKVTVRRGYIFSTFRRNDCDRDDWKRTNDGFAPHYPGYDWRTFAKWAWGVHRTVDYLLTLDCVDRDRIAVVGHSRNGATAQVAAAFDERIALCVPNNSNGLFRFRGRDTYSAGIEILTRWRPHWYHPRIRFFAGREDRLPFDLHFLKALIAPRKLLLNEAINDDCTDFFGSQQDYMAAKRIFEFLGARGSIGLRYRPGGHNMNAEDWLAILDWCDRHFKGKKDRGDFYELLYTYTFENWQTLTGAKKPDMKAFSPVAWKKPENPAAWKGLSARIRKNILWVLGDFPPAKVPEEFAVKKIPKENPAHMTRLSVDMGRGLTGCIVLPRKIQGRMPAIVYLHPYSHNTGYICKWSSRIGMSAHAFFASCGYVALTYDQLGCGTRAGTGGMAFYRKHPEWSELGKMTADVRRAVDVLRSLEYVDRDRIGVVGFSLGGIVALHAAALDKRIKAVVSACGFSPLRTEKRRSMSVGIRNLAFFRSLAPRMGFFLGNEDRLPYDYDELIALAAPRPLCVITPQLDYRTDLQQVKSAVNRAAEIYTLLGAGNRLFLDTPRDFRRFDPEQQKKAAEWLDRALIE